MDQENTQATAQAHADFEQLMAAIKGVTEAVTNVKKDVDAMKSEPPIRTGGVADMAATGQAPAVKTTPKESYADEQLAAVKAYLNKEIGSTEWHAHNQKLAQRDARQNAAFKNLTHAWKDGGRAEAEFGDAMKASLIEGTASLGGNLVPQLYGNQVIGKLKEASIVRQAGAYQFPVSGGYKFQVPTITRSGSAPIASEMGAASQMEPTFGTVDFQAYAYRAQYIASREQVLDSRVPLESLLMENAAWQFTQSENNHLAIGTGSSQPQGIAVAASTLALSPGSTAAIAFASASGSDNVLDVYHGLPYQYRATACWFANDATIKLIRKIRSGGGGAASLGDYMWVAGFGDKPDTLLGRPIYPLNNMATSGSAANVLIFGDPRFFWVADFYNGGLDFQVLNELYAASAAVGWWFWKRFDSHLVVSEAVVGMKLLS